MTQIQKFEDLIAWQKAKDLAKRIYQVTSTAGFSKDFDLVRQIRRAAVSAMSNIAEGFERNGRAEFYQFLVVAKASCAEVRSQLYLARDIGHLSEPDFLKLMQMSEELAKILGGLKTSIQKQRDERKRL